MTLMTNYYDGIIHYCTVSGVSGRCYHEVLSMSCIYISSYFCISEAFTTAYLLVSYFISQPLTTFHCFDSFPVIGRRDLYFVLFSSVVCC